MHKVFRELAKSVFCYFYEKKLSTATPEELENINEFKSEMHDLMNTLKNSTTSIAWKNYCERLWRCTVDDDVRRFLRWAPIQETMNVTFASHLKKELSFLKHSSFWNSKWKPAIMENSFGNPFPCIYYPKSSGNLVHHAYHVAKFEDNLKMQINSLDFVVEFGGGYGSMARLFYNLGFKGKYIIFDLPHFSLLQSFFLKGVGLQVHEKNKQDFSQFLCISKIEELKEIINNKINSNSLFLSTWALSETPLDLRAELTQSLTCFSHYLISYQHDYFEINNSDYFSELRKIIDSKNSENGINIIWKNFIIPHMKHSSYLFGKIS